MKFSIVLFINLLFSVNFIAYGQFNNDNRKLFAELIILEDENLIETINLLEVNNHCTRKNENWYLDFTKDNYIILSKGRLKNLIPVYNKDNNKIFITIINKVVFFIFSQRLPENSFVNTKFKVDLSEYLDSYTFTFQESSFWIFTETNGKFEILKEHIFECD